MITKLIFGICALVLIHTASANNYGDMKRGNPDITSISSLEFTPDGILFIGDSYRGTIYAIDLEEVKSNANEKPPGIGDLEGQAAALLGAKSGDILIHDLAVSPISRNIYISVSRGRANWNSKWQLPNDLAKATSLLRIDSNGELDEVSLKDVKFSEASLPNPVGTEKGHRWKKGTKLRVDAITEMVYSNGKLFISGLSNEEFASSMWVFEFPFSENVTATTLEIFHGAHGKYETHAPIRTFLPYNLSEKEHLLAAYLCTPLVTIPVETLQDKTHVKGRTVAEFGSGNYPLDMVVYQNNGKDLILMSNTQLPLLIFDPADVDAYQGSITTEVQGYMAGVSYTPRSGSGIQQLDNYDEKFIVATQRMPSGALSLISLSKKRLVK